MDYSRVVARLTYFPFEGVSSEAECSLMTEMSNKALATFHLMSTTGQQEWQIRLECDDGSIIATQNGGTHQSRDDDEALQLRIGDEDQIPEGETQLQHTWNRLIEDFCLAIQRGDVKHKTVPYLPTFADGLRTQELISAAEVSDAEGRWVQVEA